MPAAAGLVDIALLAIIGILLMLAYTLYIMGNNSPDFPFVGNVVKDWVTDPLAGLLEDLGDFILNKLVIDTTVAAFHESMQAMRNGEDIVVHVYNFANSVLWDSYEIIQPGMRAIIDYAIGYDIQGAVNELYNRTGSLQTQLFALESIVQSSPQIIDVFDTVNPVVADFLAQFNPAQFDIAINTARLALQIAENVYSEEVFIATVDLVSVHNELDFLAQIISNFGNTILDFPPNALDLLQQIPGIIGAEQTIEGILGNIGGRVGALENEITGLLPLTVIAALGITAIDTLVRLAEDPCFCFDIGGDMEWLKLAVVDQMLLNGV